MRLRRRHALALLAGVAVIFVLWVVYDYRTRPRLVAGPMVQLCTPDGFGIIWQQHPARSMRLRVQRTDGTEIGEYDAVCEDDRCSAEATGVPPGIPCLYQLVEASGPVPGRTIAQNLTRTAPPPGRSFRFLAFGDSGDGDNPQYRLARRMPEYDPDLVIHTGDLIYPSGKFEDYAGHFFTPYAKLLAAVPFYPCLGNHDYKSDRGKPFSETFLLPANGPAGDPRRGADYWFDFGSVRFVALDSDLDEDTLGSVVAPWLDGVLAGAGERWKVVYWHEPMFTGSKHKPALKLLATIAPVIDRRRVDLVLNGHNHLYERTHPIRDKHVVPAGEGTVYIVTGAGGANLYPEAARPPDYIAASCDDHHSFTLVDVTPGVLAIRQVTDEGSTVDEFQILRRTGPATKPASAPAVALR